MRTVDSLPSFPVTNARQIRRFRRVGRKSAYTFRGQLLPCRQLFIHQLSRPVASGRKSRGVGSCHELTIFATSMAKSYLLDAGLWSAANKKPASA